jgi:putative ABC transport system permease protein
VAVDKRLGFAYTMTSGDSSALGGEARKDTLLLRLTDGADLTATLGKVAALARGAHATVGRSAPQRERVQQIMKIITALVAGLLAMSVLIALVGVGNTLALSVHERRRESALLRALGVTRGQVKGMLALEGLLPTRCPTRLREPP